MPCLSVCTPPAQPAGRLWPVSQQQPRLTSRPPAQWSGQVRPPTSARAPAPASAHRLIAAYRQLRNHLPPACLGACRTPSGRAMWLRWCEGGRMWWWVIWWCGDVVVWWCGDVMMWGCGCVILWSCDHLVIWPWCHVGIFSCGHVVMLSCLSRTGLPPSLPGRSPYATLAWGREGRGRGSVGRPGRTCGGRVGAPRSNTGGGRARLGGG